MFEASLPVIMTDYFALLEEPRRPWLDADALKRKFLARSSEVHPDRIHGASEPERSLAHQRYTELNAAYTCLREPRDRLRHLLELELGRQPTDLQEVPSELADLYMEVAAVCREADRFLARRSLVTSPLLQARSFSEAQNWIERLTLMQRRSAELHGDALRQLQTLDAAWSVQETAGPAHAALLDELGNLCRQLGFVSRWSRQIQERLFLLLP
jgi:DnaJ-domain-containing protein 1